MRVDYESARFRIGDDPSWARPDLDDRQWTRRPLYAPPDTAALFWARFDVEVGTVEAPALDLSAAAAREVYWDGVWIGQSGRVGRSRAAERAGPIDTVFPVPDSLARPGRHVVAVRFSTFRRPAVLADRYVMNARVGDLRELTAAPLRAIGLPLVFLGAFVLVALYYGVLYATDRRRTPYLLTTLLCLAVAALLVAESWRPLVGYPYDLHVVRLRVVAGLTCGVGWLLAAVFVVQYRLPRGRLVLGGLAVAIAATQLGRGGYDLLALAVFAVSLPTALGATLWAVARRRAGAALAAAGVAVCLGALLATGFRFLDTAFFPSFGVLLAGLLASLGLQTRDARRRHQATRAEAARLEAELLRKHLQPHFLMNTLTSVMECVETDPDAGARALGALAGELRALSDVTGEPLIPLRRELALCRAHLDVMSFRRDVRFTLDAEGVDEAAPVPPAVLHTLVENAVTHNAYPPGPVCLVLREGRVGGRRRLTLRAPLVGEPRLDRPERGGLGYVRARLEESFPGRWALTAAVEDGHWVTQIDLPPAEGGDERRSWTRTPHRTSGAEVRV